MFTKKDDFNLIVDNMHGNKGNENSYITITNGPTKFDLASSLFSGSSSGRSTVKFFIDGSNGNCVEVLLEQIQREDGSGESWNFWGYEYSNSRRKIQGYYSTKTGKGNFKFV